jgi:hypothetical protein
MARVTNITSTVIEKRLGLTPKQEEALHGLQVAFDKIYENGMGAKEIAVLLHDIGPAVPGQINEWQPFAFATVYFDDDLFSAFMNGDTSAREEATFPSPKLSEHLKSK